MSNKEKVSFSSMAADFYQMHPQEMLAPAKTHSKKSLSIGIPKEASPQENRVALRPEAVSILVNNGYRVLFEKDAGALAKFTDTEYSEAGAEIVLSPKDALESDIILKISPPTLEEVALIKPHKAVISALQTSTMTKEYIEAINKKEITALAFEFIEDKVGGYPIVRAMSEIAGSTVMLIAAELLSSMNNGKGIIMGGITGVPPTKVVIIGAGTVGEFAARTALGLGAEIKIYDNHVYKLRRIKQRIGQHHIYTCTLDTTALTEALSRADVAIGAIRSDGRTPCIVTEEMVNRMQANSVIIDVSIDQGGCFETSRITTHQNPVFRRFDVIHYCVPNIASRVARTASTAVSNILVPWLVRVLELGGVDQMIFDHKWFAKGVYTYRGGITHRSIADKFGMPYKNLDLLIVANI